MKHDIAARQICSQFSRQKIGIGSSYVHINVRQYKKSINYLFKIPYALNLVKEYVCLPSSRNPRLQVFPHSGGIVKFHEIRVLKVDGYNLIGVDAVFVQLPLKH